MNVSKSDAVTYAALVIGAVLQAAEPLRKEVAMPPEAHPILSNQAWSYVPLGLLTLVGLIWLVRQFLPPAKTPTARPDLANPNQFPTPDWHEPLIPVVNKKFSNQIVQLDGKQFVDCEFRNVTFRYNGTKPTSMTHCTRSSSESSFTFQTENPTVQITMEIINWLRVTGGDKSTVTRDMIRGGRDN